jgi:hypothetical protein
LLNLSYHKNWKKKRGNLDWHKDLGFFKQDFGYQQFVCFFFFHLWCKLQIVIYFNKSEVQKVELQSLVPLLVREETDKRRSKRRAFKINPPSKNIRNEQTVELNSGAVVQIWHTINQSELWGFY